MAVNLALPTLPAKQAGWVRQLLADDALLVELAHGLGGPFHVLYPERFSRNVEAFRSILDSAGVSGRIFYAKKANKAGCWLDRCTRHGIGTDVASVPELRDALARGLHGSDVVVTGPAKSTELLNLAVRHDSLIAVDSPDELDRIAGLGARILLRCLPPSAPHSRFGLTQPELDAAVQRCAGSGGSIRLEGFSFHLSGYDVTPRAELAAQLVRRCLRARELGLPADVVDIGGGFAVDYVAGQDWRRFTEGERTEWYHAGKRFDGFYPYHSPVAGPAMLTAILDTVPAGHRGTLAAQLREADVTLALEPGRALLDQTGCTVFTVQGVKDRGHGILTVDGTSLSLSEQWFGSEFLPDPVLLPDLPGTPYPACVGGASCLESDMLTWRTIVFRRRPAVGDRLVYLNTAGYQMDSNESPFHGLPLPPKVVLDRHGGQFRWQLDRAPH